MLELEAKLMSLGRATAGGHIDVSGLRSLCGPYQSEYPLWPRETMFISGTMTLLRATSGSVVRL